jgi:hypothetical protein
MTLNHDNKFFLGVKEEIIEIDPATQKILNYIVIIEKPLNVMSLKDFLGLINFGGQTY